MIKILLGLLLLVGIYYYMQGKKEPMKNKKPYIPTPRDKSFIASKKFAGAKNGYVFKMDSHGLGYYLDTLT